MPYGTIRPETLAHLIKRATESGVPVERLGLDASFDEDSIPDNAYEITLIYGGALDESFYVISDYEVNIADWCAELLRTESEADADHEDWQVFVTEVQSVEWGAGEQRYVVRSTDA